MSYAVMPYAVSIAAVKKCVGSRDAELLARLKKEFSRELAVDPFSDDDDKEAVTCERALSDLIAGNKLNDDYGFQYGYALKILCAHFGRHLPNVSWSATRATWIEKVDATLAQAGVERETFQVQKHLMYRGFPISVPRIEEFPAIGYLLENELAKVQAALTKAVGKISDREVTECLKEVQKWIDHCAGAHQDLVCFYH